jgi:hypothetical protein
MWASGSIVEMRAESYGVFLSQSAIRVERICARPRFWSQGNDLSKGGWIFSKTIKIEGVANIAASNRMPAQVADTLAIKRFPN